MFGSKKSGNGGRGVETLIARNTAIEGKLKFNGMLTIEGSVVGDIISSEKENSVVRITQEGKVRGEVHSPEVVINGHVEGDVFASVQLVLASDAVVDGNIHYNLIEMEKGAQINGNMFHSVPSTDKAETKTRLSARIQPAVDPDKQELVAS